MSGFENIIVEDVDELTKKAMLGKIDFVTRKKVIEENFKEILWALGIDSDDANFKETPKRYAKMMLNELCDGLYHSEEKIKEIFSKSFPSNYSGMVTQKNIRCYGLCPHHFITVIYDISFAYLPANRMLGLSKLSRFIELLAKRPVLQEDLTHEIVKIFVRYINPFGCFVIVKGRHLCMESRGVKQQNSVTITSELSGVFNTDGDAKKEVMDLCK